ncbi:MAG TPA: nuclear transport factor 2 family protein [Candidatus Limnocylindrales bacterium]|nr:nuclear transport factor 2 family protein [Candidatus Limnocylindrales bacterium]
MGDNSEAIRRYRQAVESGDLASMGGLIDEFAADGFYQEWPQSGERINAENSKKLAEQYSEQTGTNPTIRLKGIRESGDLVVIEGTIDYGNGVPVSYVGIGEFRDGKVQRMTEYFADPFEAPAWRAPFVERMAAAGDVT